MPRKGSIVNDYTGRRFGRLVVVGVAGKQGRTTLWECKCDCGNSHVSTANNMATGGTSSCGCLRSITARRKHGLTRTPEHVAWVSMKSRTRHRGAGRDRYIARGIKVCERWEHSFENFLADVGPRPGPEYSLDRINNDGNYEPGNCRWATDGQQARNQERTRNLTAFGKTQCLTDWSIEYGIRRATIADRLKRGWGTERAISTPTNGSTT